MQTRAQLFFSKKSIALDNILFFIHKNQQTEIHLTNGNIISTYLPVKELLTALPGDSFLSINKGLVIAKKYISSISGNIYTMVDGTVFSGRVRTPGKHLAAKYELLATAPAPVTAPPLQEQLLLLENLPLPFCLLEARFSSKDNQLELLLHYGNREMSQLTEKSPQESSGSPLKNIFPKVDQKLIFSLAGIALNGGNTLCIYKDSLQKKTYRLYCYQTKKNFCGCLFIPQ